MDDELVEMAADVQQDIDGMAEAQRRKWIRQFQQSQGEDVDIPTTIKWIALSQQWSAAKAAGSMLAQIRKGRLHTRPRNPPYSG